MWAARRQGSLQTHNKNDAAHPNGSLLPRNLYYKNILQAKKFKLQLYTKRGLFPSQRSQNKLPKPRFFRSALPVSSFSWGSIHKVWGTARLLGGSYGHPSSSTSFPSFLFRKLKLYKMKMAPRKHSQKILSACVHLCAVYRQEGGRRQFKQPTLWRLEMA